MAYKINFFFTHRLSITDKCFRDVKLLTVIINLSSQWSGSCIIVNDIRFISEVNQSSIIENSKTYISPKKTKGCLWTLVGSLICYFTALLKEQIETQVIFRRLKLCFSQQFCPCAKRNEFKILQKKPGILSILFF